MTFKIVKDKELIHRLSEYTADRKWMRDNWDDLVKKFPDFYIAIKDKRVWYSHEDFITLLMLMDVGGDDPAQWVVDFVNTEPIHYILQGYREMLVAEVQG